VAPLPPASPSPRLQSPTSQSATPDLPSKPDNGDPRRWRRSSPEVEGGRRSLELAQKKKKKKKKKKKT